MCAPRDQRKSSDNQRQQAGLNAVRYQVRANLSGCRGFNSRNEGLWNDDRPWAQRGRIGGHLAGASETALLVHRRVSMLSSDSADGRAG